MSPRRAIPTKTKSSGLPTWVYIVGGAVVVVLAALGLYLVQSSQTQPPAASVSAGSRTAGNPTAKVALVVFSDFQCVYCRQFAVTVEGQIEEQYVKSNKISFTYKYFPIIDQGRIGESHWSAEAAECANEQGKFWEYHDKLFSVWTGENVGTYTKDKLKQYATSITGLDTAKFNQCLDTDKYASTVTADEAEGKRMGVQGTPAFYINGKALNVTSFDLSQFSNAIDPLLQ